MPIVGVLGLRALDGGYVKAANLAGVVRCGLLLIVFVLPALESTRMLKRPEHLRASEIPRPIQFAHHEFGYWASTYPQIFYQSI